MLMMVENNLGKNDMRQSSKASIKLVNFWQLAYQQEKACGSFDTPEIDWEDDLESTDFD